MARLVAGCFTVALLFSTTLVHAEDEQKPKPDKPSLAGTLYAEFGFLFNLVHVPQATADGGFGVRIAVGYHFSEKLRGHFAYRSLSNENKDQPSSDESYSDVSLGVALSLDGKYFTFEGEVTRAAIAGSGFDESGLGGGVYFAAGYPLNPHIKVIGRVGAFIAFIDVPSAAPQFRERTPLWGLVGVALVYQGAPWGN